MALNPLDQEIYALDRQIEIDVFIRGQLLSSGLSENSRPDVMNLIGVDVEFDIEQLPPTAVLTIADIAMHFVKIDRGDTVEIDAGFNGHLERIFTGHVKRRRHGVAADIIDCTGRTGVLTRPFRASNEFDRNPKSWTSQTAVFAIEDILDDLTPPFTPTNIDPILLDDGVTDFSIGTVVPARMDLMPPSDMIRKLADVYGHRPYEQKSGTLRIRDLLEAPAPTGYRIYGTQGTDRLANTTLSFNDTNIDTALTFGDVAASTRRAQGFTPTSDGNAVRIALWLRKVGAPTDRVRLTIEEDDDAGEPNGVVLGGGDDIAGSILIVGTYTRVDVVVTTETRLVNGRLYHLVVDRSGALDAVNHYEVGADSTAGYAGGIANVFDGANWSAAGGDLAFEVEHSAFPTLRLLNIADDEDEDQVKKQVIVRGISVPSTTPASGDDPGGDETQTQITAERHTDSNDLVAGDYELYSLTYQNDLIETTLIADEVAARLVDKYHRILQSIEIEVPFDPRIDLGSTIEIQDEGVSPNYLGEITGLGGNWWIRGYRHTLTPTGAVTHISLFGGDQSGTTSEANPQADFYWTIERELVGNAIQAVITFHDASTDADGWITHYRWVDDYLGGVNDVEGEGEAFRVVTFAYDPAVDASVNMTLTVTDNDGNTDSFTVAVDITSDNEEVFAPVVVCAAGNTCMATFDGGLSWRDISTPSGDARTCEVTYDNNNPDSPPLLFFGTNNGRIFRSADTMATLTEVAGTALTAGSEVTGIRADKRIRERIWACCSNGIILRSNDFGVTWSTYANIGVTWPTRNQFQGLNTPMNSDFRIDPVPINGIMVSEPSVNRIWVFGGNGQEPQSWFHTHYLGDDPRVWTSEVATGDGDADPTGTASDTVVDTVVSHRTSGDLGLLFSGRNPVFTYAAPRYYDDIGGGSTWVDIGGTPAVDGVSVAGNNNRLRLFGMVMDNTNFYRSQDGYGVWEELVGVLPGTGANRPHDLLQVALWKDIYISAMDEGIAKSIDYGETWAFFRPQGAPINTVWPVGARGWDCAIEYRRPRRFDIMAIVRDSAASTENALAIRTGHGAWADAGPLPTAHADRPHRLWHFPQIDGSTLFYLRYTNGTLDHVEDLHRSVNLGGLWTNVLTRCGTIARGPDGRMWATRENHADPTGHLLGNRYPHAIFFSDDDGATWTIAHEDTRNSAGQFISYFNIAVDPNNGRRVMAAGHFPAVGIRILVTEDAHLGAGATWSEVPPSAQLTGYEGIAPRQHQPLLIAGQNGRWILGKQLNAVSTLEIWISDNNGADWERKFSINMSGSTFGFSDAFRIGNILFFGGGLIGNSVDTRGRVSFNNGDDWEELTAEGARHQGFVHDPRFDMLVVNLNSADELKYMQPTEVGQSWVEGLEAGLDAAMGYTAQMVENALAVAG